MTYASRNHTFAIHTGYPKYLKEKLQFLVYEDAIAIRNSNNPLRLIEPRVEGSAGPRSFSFNAPRIFNKLPLNLKEIANPSLFRKKLKTYFFSRAFDVQTNTTNAEYKL